MKQNRVRGGADPGDAEAATPPLRRYGLARVDGLLDALGSGTGDTGGADCQAESACCASATASGGGRSGGLGKKMAWRLAVPLCQWSCAKAATGPGDRKYARRKPGSRPRGAVRKAKNVRPCGLREVKQGQ